MAIPSREQNKILNDFSFATSRLTTKMIPNIKRSFSDLDLIDLLMALPVKFELNEIDVEATAAGAEKKITAKELALGGYITRDTENNNPDRLVVFLTFNKDINTTWDLFFKELLTDEYYHNMLAFIYLHEALHILMRHYDFYLNANYIDIINALRPELPEKSKNDILNAAFDYWINAYLIEQATTNTFISNFQKEDSNFTGLYDPNLSPKVTTQQEIVQKLTEEAKINKTDITDAAGNVIGSITEVDINGFSSRSIIIDGNHEDIRQDSRESSAEQEIDEVLESTRNNLLEKTRGSESTGTLAQLGVDYSVPTDWFKLLKNSIFTMVRHYTNNYDQTWGKIKNKFRHVSLMPGKIYYEKELAAIISIDQSGSMSNSDLEKINYVVTELAKKSMFVEILLHDTKIAERKKFIGKQFPGIHEFITNRVACGGTSHVKVFEAIKEIKEDNPKTKLIYLSFSDNYSDIEEAYDDNIFKKISTYWITTDERKTVNVPGMQISLERGLLEA